ncbi:MAG: AI-2E family transporter [Myxococcales bacterium]|nr:AI-2E family transporter [Myxococcales bacterium]
MSTYQSSPSSPGAGGGGLSPPRYYRRVFALVAFAVLGYFLFRILAPFTSAILWAALLTFMLMPLQRRLDARWKRPMLSAGLLTALTFLVVAGPVTIFGFAFTRQASELIARMQSEAHNRNLPALQLVLEFKPVHALISSVGAYTSLSEEEILNQAADALREAANKLASLGGTVVIGAFGAVSQFLMMLFLLFFLLRDGRGMVERFVRLVPLSPERKAELQTTLGGVASAVVLGALATSVVQGTLLGIGFAIAGLPSPLVFGAVGAVASLIPIVGTALVWIPAVITLVAQGRTGWAVFLAIWCVVLVAGSDNVIKPLVISGRSKASTLLVLVGLLGGVATFGFAGLFMGPLVLTLGAALLQFADEAATGVGLGMSPAVALTPAPASAPLKEKPADPPAPAKAAEEPQKPK